MNKKGIATEVIVIGVILLLLFIFSFTTAIKIFSILKDIPSIVWWGLIILILYKLFFGGKK